MELSSCFSKSGFRNYNLKELPEGYSLSKAYFQGRKITREDGWFLFGKRNTDCSNWNYSFQSVTLHPQSREFQYLDASSQVAKYLNSYIKIVSYKNTELGPDNVLYVCVIPPPPLCPPGWSCCQESTFCQWNGCPQPTRPPGFWSCPPESGGGQGCCYDGCGICEP